MTANLKPCPICGNGPIENSRGGAFGFICSGIGTPKIAHRVQSYGGSRTEAIAAWNQRYLASIPDGGERGEEARRRARKAITDRYFAGGKVVQLTSVRPAELVDIVIEALGEAPRQQSPFKQGDVAFLQEGARYFDKRPTNGEDAAHWANIYNAENCRRIADAILSTLTGEAGEGG